MIPIRSRSGRLPATLGAIALLAATLLSGCAMSAPESPGSTDPKPGVSSSTYEQDYADWQHKFYGCMRAEGIDVKDPGPNEMPSLDGADAAVMDALNTCGETVGAAPVNPNVPTIEEMDEQQRIFAKCMRDAGYEWEDPAPSTGGGNAPGVKPIDPNAYDSADLDRCAVEAGYTTAGSGR